MIVIIFCRNPDGDVQPWCYIADHEDGIYWRYCDIPTCQSKRLPLLYLALCLHPFHALRGKSWAYGPTTFIAMLIFSPAMNSFYGLRWLVHSYYHLKNVSNCLPSLLLLPCLGLSSSCHCLLVCVWMCVCAFLYISIFISFPLWLCSLFWHAFLMWATMCIYQFVDAFVCFVHMWVWEFPCPVIPGLICVMDCLHREI